MLYAQSTAKVHVRATQHVLLPQIQFPFRFHIPLMMIGEVWGRNEVERIGKTGPTRKAEMLTAGAAYKVGR